MAGIAVQWSFFGNFDSFNIYKSVTVPLDVETLPTPIAMGVVKMFYIDPDVAWGETTHYMVEAVRGSEREISAMFTFQFIFNTPDLYVVYQSDADGGIVLLWEFEE